MEHTTLFLWNNEFNILKTRQLGILVSTNRFKTGLPTLPTLHEKENPSGLFMGVESVDKPFLE